MCLAVEYPRAAPLATKDQCLPSSQEGHVLCPAPLWAAPEGSWQGLGAPLAHTMRSGPVSQQRKG